MVFAEFIKKPQLSWMLALCCAALGGCSFGLGRPSLKSPDPSLRIPAIKQAGIQHNTHAVPQLLRALESHDPAVRFYAGYALEEISGRNFGYVYYAPRARRAAAVARWRAWYAHTPQGGH